MKLKLNEIVYLQQLYKETTPLSLIANLTAATDGTEGLSLGEKGILNGDAAGEAAKKPLDLLAHPKSCSRIVLKNPFCTIEKYVYRKDDERLLVENNNGEMDITLMTTESPVQFELAQWMGATSIKTAEFSSTLSFDELLCFLSLLDFHRKNVLRGYLGENSLKDSLSETMLLKIMSFDATASPDESVSLIHAVIKSYGLKLPSIEGIKKALGGLKDKGVIANTDNISLKDNYKIFAQYFLVPDTVLMLESLQLLGDGSVNAANSLAIGSGVLSWLLITFGEKDAEIMSVSSVELLEGVRQHLICES